MDLSNPKVTNADKLNLCRKYFQLGFALLPFLWAINSVWFFHEAFMKKPEYPEQAQIRRYVIMSAIGSLVFLAGLIAWISVFMVNRAEWGEFGDVLSFNIPTGVK